MITAREYPQAIAAYGYENLTPGQKEAHDLISEGSENFTDFDLLDEMMEDDDIRSTIEIFLEQVTNLIKPAKAAAQTPAAKSEKPPRAKKEPKPKPEKKPRAKKEPKPKPEKKPRAKKEPVPKPAPKPRAAKKTKPAKAAKPKTSDRKPANRKFQESYYTIVPRIPAEVAFIKRYLRLDNREITRAQLLNFIKDIEAKNIEGQFTVKGKYGKDVKHIYGELLKVYNDPKTPATKPFTFMLDSRDKNLRERFGHLVEHTIVDYSVQYLKSYLNLLKAATKPKAKALLTKIDNAYEVGKIKAGGKFTAYVDKARRKLSAYVNSDTPLTHTSIELQGLAGILNININHGAPARKTRTRKTTTRKRK